MQVFVEEHLHLVLVYLTHALRRDGNLITILVRALLRNLIYRLDTWTVVVENSKVREICFWERRARKVIKALVTLDAFSQANLQ